MAKKISQADVARETLLDGTRLFSIGDDEENFTIEPAATTAAADTNAWKEQVTAMEGLDAQEKRLTLAMGLASDYKHQSRSVRNVELTKKPDADHKISNFKPDSTKDTIAGMLGAEWAAATFPNELVKVMTKQAILHMLLHTLKNDDANHAKRELIMQELAATDPMAAVEDHDRKLLAKHKADMIREPVFEHAKSKSRIISPPLPGKSSHVEDRALKELLSKVGGQPFDMKNPKRSLDSYLRKLYNTVSGIYNEEVVYAMLQHILAGDCLDFVEAQQEEGHSLSSTWVLLQTLAGADSDMSSVASQITKILTQKPDALFPALLKLKNLVRKKNSMLADEVARRSQNDIDLEKYIMIILKNFYPLYHVFIKNEYLKSKRVAASALAAAKLKAAASGKQPPPPNFDPYGCLILLLEQSIGTEADVHSKDIETSKPLKVHALEVSSESQLETQMEAMSMDHQDATAVLDLMAYNIRPSNPAQFPRPIPPRSIRPVGLQQMNQTFGTNPRGVGMNQTSGPRFGHPPYQQQQQQQQNRSGGNFSPNRMNPFGGVIPPHLSNPPKCLLCGSGLHSAKSCSIYQGQFPDLSRKECEYCRCYHEGGAKGCRNLWQHSQNQSLPQVAAHELQVEPDQDLLQNQASQDETHDYDHFYGYHPKLYNQNE